MNLYFSSFFFIFSIVSNILQLSLFTQSSSHNISKVEIQFTMSYIDNPILTGRSVSL